MTLSQIELGAWTFVVASAGATVGIVAIALVQSSRPSPSARMVAVAKVAVSALVASGTVAVLTGVFG